MARRSNVPKFGDWENEGNVPYTVYFDKARKNRGTDKPINPNDPAQFQQARAPPVAPRTNQGAADGTSNGRVRPTEQRRPANEPAMGQGRRPQRGENSIDASPLHRNQQGRAGGVTPGRANPKQGLRSVHDERDHYSSAAVPEFGGWENNPETGENYTERFNKVRQDRDNGSVGPKTPTGYNSNHGSNRPPRKIRHFLCFSW